jgi:hypothetical protein
MCGCDDATDAGHAVDSVGVLLDVERAGMSRIVGPLRPMGVWPPPGTPPRGVRSER